MRLLDHAGPTIGQVIGSIAADDDGLPMVFHCHAGKDRTGVIAALLLESLGVPRSVVVDDYEATARYRVHTDDPETHQKLIELGMLPEVAAGILSTPRRTDRGRNRPTALPSGRPGTGGLPFDALSLRRAVGAPGCRSPDGPVSRSLVESSCRRS